MIYADNDAHPQLLAVPRAVQRKGIGSKVLVWLERVARDAGAARIGLEAREHNTLARSFYAAHNYQERAIEAEMYSGVESGVRFEKWLRARET